jgi:hypothetical protein
MVMNFSEPLPFSSFSRSLSQNFLSFIQDMIFRLSIWRYNDIGLTCVPDKTAKPTSSDGPGIAKAQRSGAAQFRRHLARPDRGRRGLLEEKLVIWAYAGAKASQLEAAPREKPKSL